jgi:hypothetical protein
MKAANCRIKWEYSKAKGRITHCLIQKSDFSVYVSFAETSPMDHFSRDIGRKLSLARALKNANLSKEERKEIWEAYRNLTKKPRW